MRRWSVVWTAGWVIGLWGGAHGWLPFAWLLAVSLLVIAVGGWWVYWRWSGFQPFLFLAAILMAATYMTWIDDHNRSVWSAEHPPAPASTDHSAAQDQSANHLSPTHPVELRGYLVGQIASPVTIDGNRVQFTLRSETWQWGENRSILDNRPPSESPHARAATSPDTTPHAETSPAATPLAATPPAATTPPAIVSPTATGGEKVVVRLTVKRPADVQTAQTLQRGNRIGMTVVLQQPPQARNPGAFDYRTYLYRQHVHWTAKVDTLEDVERLSSGFHWLRPLDSLRNFLSKRIAAIYDEPVAGLVRGMILGERQAVDPLVERQFATLGLLHLLAISGLHVGIVVALCYGGLKWFGMTRERAALCALLFLPVYALLTGAGTPVVRAAIVGGLVLLTVVWRQWKDSLHFLALAGAAMLLWNPYWLFEAGFQLSFAITVAIVVGVPVLSERLAFGPLVLRQTLATTLIAQLCSFPLIIYYFNEFSLLSGLANAIVVPVVSVVVIPLAFLTVLMAAVAVPLASLLAQFNALVVTGVLALADQFAAWEGFHLVWATPPLWWIGVYFVALYALYVYGLQRPLVLARWRRAFASFAFLLVVWLAYNPLPWGDRPLTVTFLDVGQGDAVVVETPQRQTIVYDAGPKALFGTGGWRERRNPFDVGKQVVIPYLRHRGIRTIDYLVMSHGDADHIGGMQAIVEAVPVRHFVRGPDTSEPSTVETQLMQALEAKNVPVYRAASGVGWELERGLYWQFVQADPQVLRTDERNAQSVIVRLAFAGRSFLLTGDADVEAEEAMLDAWNVPPVDVLKAGHHGSKTSTGETLVQKLRPRIAILSAGINNRYNHPHPDVVARLQQAGVAMFRTDWQGGIVCRVARSGELEIVPTLSTSDFSGRK